MTKLRFHSFRALDAETGIHWERDQDAMEGNGHPQLHDSEYCHMTLYPDMTKHPNSLTKKKESQELQENPKR